MKFSFFFFLIYLSEYLVEFLLDVKFGLTHFAYTPTIVDPGLLVRERKWETFVHTFSTAPRSAEMAGFYSLVFFCIRIDEIFSATETFRQTDRLKLE